MEDENEEEKEEKKVEKEQEKEDAQEEDHILLRTCAKEKSKVKSETKGVENLVCWAGWPIV
jgi:hypothetical protein